MSRASLTYTRRGTPLLVQRLATDRLEDLVGLHMAGVVPVQVKGVPFSKLQGSHDAHDRGQPMEKVQFPVERAMVRAMEPVMVIPSGTRPVPMLQFGSPQALPHSAEILDLNSNFSTARSSDPGTPVSMNHVPDLRLGPSELDLAESAALLDRPFDHAAGMSMPLAGVMPSDFADGSGSSQSNAQGNSIFEPRLAQLASSPELPFRPGMTKSEEFAGRQAISAGLVEAQRDWPGGTSINTETRPQMVVDESLGNEAEPDGSIFAQSWGQLSSGIGPEISSTPLSKSADAMPYDEGQLPTEKAAEGVSSQLDTKPIRTLSRVGSEASLDHFNPDASNLDAAETWGTEKMNNLPASNEWAATSERPGTSAGPKARPQSASALGFGVGDTASRSSRDLDDSARASPELSFRPHSSSGIYQGSRNPDPVRS